MTTIEELKAIVSRGETSRVEFKKKVNHPDKIVREMVAFANARGGTLLIGIDDDKNIIGVRDPIEEMEALNKTIHEMVRPEIKFRTGQIPITQKRKVVYYLIKESRNKPHYVNPSSKSKNGIAYFRYEDKTIQASSELLQVIRRNKRNKNGFMFHYGSTEEMIIKYIDKKGKITINEFHEVMGIKKNEISKALVNLVLANVLEMEPRDGEDVYLSKQPE